MDIYELSKAALIVPPLVFLTISGCAKARDHHHGRHQGPPPEAIQACAGKTDGSRVTFTGRNGDTIAARCQEIDGRLVAVPEGMPKDHTAQPN